MLQKRSGHTKKHILLCDSIYVKSKARQNKAMMSEAGSRSGGLRRMCKGNAVKGHAGTFYGDKNMFHLLSISYSV